MKTHLIYLGTPGVGENIQCIPSWREWSADFGEDMYAVLPQEQAASGLFNMAAHIIGYDIRWEHDGAIHLDKRLVSAVETLIRSKVSTDPDDRFKFASRQHINVVDPLPTNFEAQLRYASAPVPVVEGNGLMLNGHGASDHTFALSFPAPGKPVAMTLCSGSFEPMRSIPPTAFVRLFRELVDQLGLGHGSVNLVLTGPRYLDAIGMIDPKLLKYINESYLDEETGKSLALAARAIHDAELVVTPDSGPLHIALASRMMKGKAANGGLIFLPTREDEKQVLSEPQLEYCTVLKLPDPACAKDCRGRLGGYTSVPSNYPWSLACSNDKAVPCLRFSPEQAKELAAHIVAAI